MLNKTERLFLETVTAAVNGTSVQWTDAEEITAEEWQELFRLADIQSVFPMVYQAVFKSAPFAKSGLAGTLQGKMRQSVMQQVMKTSEFLAMVRQLKKQNSHPAVVKGIICREMYPDPDLRISGDEDLFIPESQYMDCVHAMETFGMEVAQWDKEILGEHYEVSFVKEKSFLRVELHKSLFDESDITYRKLNELFANSYEQAIDVTVQGVTLRTLNWTDHFMFLICHAYKHFIGSGFGIRQVCDILMMAKTYGTEIDWKRVVESMQYIHAEQFVAALFTIGSQYLNFHFADGEIPVEFLNSPVDAEVLLKDILEGGIYGSADAVRLHSSSITLNAMSDQAKGKQAKAGILRTLFPQLNTMKGRYPYLTSKPWMLPIAWGDRLIRYRKRTAGNTDQAAASVKIGKQRIDLLKSLGIISEPDDGKH